MKNRILVFIVAFVSIILFSTEKLSAQVTSESNSSWIGLSSYNGSITVNAFRFSINIKGENINYPNWSLVVRANSPITNSEGKIFDPSKISIRINEVTGGPSLTELGANQTPIPLSFNDKYIINRSSFPLKNGKGEYYKKYTFDFDIIIAGGSYLENLKTYKQYLLSLTFSVLGANDKVVTESSPSVKMQIYPDDTPPSGPEFGFEVNANATLNFNTPEQYTRQVENNPINSWVNVTSKNSGYVIKVKANNPNFELIRNDSGVSGDATIPVNVVNVEMQSAGSGTSQGAKTLSSTTAQTLFIGTKNNNPQKLPVRYFITKTEAEKLATKKSGEYRTILTYTLETN